MSFHKTKTDPLPQGWIAAPLSDFVLAKSGNSKLIKGKMHNAPALHLFQGFSASGADVWSDAYEYDADGVVVSAVGARCGKSFLAKGKWVAVANTHVVLPFEDSLDIKFIWYGINDEEFWVKSGTAQPFVVVSKSFERLFAIPPRAEQTRIVAKLEELLSDLDAGVAELKAAQKKLAQYRQSLLKAAVEGALTAQWRAKNTPSETGAQLLQRILKERRARWEAKQLAKYAAQGKTPPKDWQKKYPEPVQPDTTGLPQLPEGWVWASVDCLLSDIETGKSFKCIERPPTEDEIGVVKVSAVSWGEYNEQESKTCTNEELVNPELMIKPGDFLFSRANTVELVGACVIAQAVSLKVMLSDKILRLLLVQNGLKPWLLYFLRSQIGRRQIELLATGNQESMRNIGQERLRSIAIPVGPKAEIDYAISLVQQELTSASLQITANEFGLKQATAQRQNILRAAFSGQLVPQDPNDEPASRLLERIRAERAAQVKQSRPRRHKTATRMKE